jgi:hypothetical protein
MANTNLQNPVSDNDLMNRGMVQGALTSLFSNPTIVTPQRYTGNFGNTGAPLNDSQITVAGSVTRIMNIVALHPHIMIQAGYSVALTAGQYVIATVPPITWEQNSSYAINLVHNSTQNAIAAINAGLYLQYYPAVGEIRLVVPSGGYTLNGAAILFGNSTVILGVASGQTVS